MAKVNNPKSKQNYRTPVGLLHAIEKRFGKITFDAACMWNDCVVRWTDHSDGMIVDRVSGFLYDQGEDALEQDWTKLQGQHIFCNPPFRKSGKFAKKIHDTFMKTEEHYMIGTGEIEPMQIYRGPKISFLVQCAVDSKWFLNYIQGRAMVMPLLPRVPFLNTDGTPVLDGKGKQAPINRAMMLVHYSGPGQVGFNPWEWNK